MVKCNCIESYLLQQENLSHSLHKLRKSKLYMLQQNIDILLSLILQVISQLQWEGNTSSVAFLQATRIWRSRPCCPSPTLVWLEWTQLGISQRAWRNPWQRPNTSLELWLSSTSSCPWRQGTRSASTSSPASWPTPLNLWPSLVGCCCTRPSDRLQFHYDLPV